MVRSETQPWQWRLLGALRSCGPRKTLHGGWQGRRGQGDGHEAATPRQWARRWRIHDTGQGRRVIRGLSVSFCSRGSVLARRHDCCLAFRACSFGFRGSVLDCRPWSNSRNGRRSLWGERVREVLRLHSKQLGVENLRDLDTLCHRLVERHYTSRRFMQSVPLPLRQHCFRSVWRYPGDLHKLVPWCWWLCVCPVEPLRVRGHRRPNVLWELRRASPLWGVFFGRRDAHEFWW
mmetsp:Transcript_23757/g.55324  ORF Transcript_23757/g.55324 Transcript_23757/m.55324 type:complete len:233 (+) Transcript_23757:149-847(+)